MKLLSLVCVFFSLGALGNAQHEDFGDAPGGRRGFPSNIFLVAANGLSTACNRAMKPLKVVPVVGIVANNMPCNVTPVLEDLIEQTEDTGECDVGLIKVEVDLGLAPCFESLSICAKGQNVLGQVLSLVLCILKSLPKVVSRVGTILVGVGSGVRHHWSYNLTINSVLLLVYLVARTVLQLLCLEAPVLLSAVVSLSPGLFIVLIMAALGLALGVPVLGALLAAPLALVSVIVAALTFVLSSLLIVVVSLLQLLLGPLSILLIMLLSEILGITPPCGAAHCPSSLWSSLLSLDPFGIFGCVWAAVGKILPLTSTRFTTGLVSRILSTVLGIPFALPLVGTVVTTVGSLLEAI